MKKRRRKKEERKRWKGQKRKQKYVCKLHGQDGSDCTYGGDLLSPDRVVLSSEHPSIVFQPPEQPALPLPTATGGAHLKSLFVTGCLSSANGFSVTSLAGPSSPLLCGELDPIWKVPPGSCTMAPSPPSAAKGQIQPKVHF